MFGSVLVANRGEIACRVIRTCRELGLRAVAVFAEPDRHALHVAAADEAHGIPDYLDVAAILEAAARAGAEAIHPGYGFLAENEAFAAACAEAGRIFVGPPVEALRAMGTKAAAREIMQRAGVPVVPGYHGEEQTLDRLVAEAQRIGYPVLLKASAGGGGKGMRLVERPDALEAALEAARRESRKAFGDDRMLLEQWIERSRHIEVQVFADDHGNVLHLHERECSIQRRYQKVLEESPAPGLDVALRERICAAGVAAARAVGYRNAGTVEFILGADGAFYFMEMNTRLQVEHPVTEMITGLDLVAWQLAVAAGQPLPEPPPPSGHAIEARLYAEDPARDFLPSTGRLDHLRWPGNGVRIDTGVREGDAVTIHYDPLLAKLIVRGEDRRQAVAALRRALDECQVAGPRTNLGLLQALVRHPEFEAGRIDTGFIPRHAGALVLPAPGERELALAALALLRGRSEAACEAQAHTADPHSPWARVEGFRLAAELVEPVRFHEGTVEVTTLGSGRYRIGAHEAAGELDGRTLRAVVDRQPVAATAVRSDGALTLFCDGRTYRLTLEDPLALVDAGADEEGGRLVAPMPGTVIQVLVAAGAAVKQGEPLLVLEAMKMEQTIFAPADGVVQELHFRAGDQVEEGAVLVAFEAHPA